MGSPEKPDHAQFYTELVTKLLEDIAISLQLKPSSIDRDKRHVVECVKTQGLSYLTVALPSLAKALDKALALDEPFVCPEGFRTDKEGCPILFGDIFKLTGLFTSRLADCQPSIRRVGAIRAIRQIGYLLYKLELPHTEKQLQQAVEKYKQLEASLPDVEEEVPLSIDTQRALESARMVLWYVLKDLNLSDIVPGHGPGAVATGEKSHEKMQFRRIYSQAEESYPVVDWFFCNYTHLCDSLDSLEEWTVEEQSCSSLRFVPKDSRGPRTISMEPLELQWLQQGQLRALVRHIESSKFTRGFVNFTDQTVNRRLALLSSSTTSPESKFVTLDMEDASDRVTHWLVKQLLPAHVYTFLKATRSEYTAMPDGSKLKLRKFAPMGSSVCFPIEAIIFWALAVGALVRVRRASDMLSLPPVYVYGDDIIARKGDFGIFAPVFEELRLRFSKNKCCIGRLFRESCGCDAYQLADVTPLRIHTTWSRLLSPQQLLSYVAYINGFGERHLNRTRAWLLEKVEAQAGVLPRAQVGSHLFGAVLEYDWKAAEVDEFNFTRFRFRYHTGYQTWQLRLPAYSTRTIVRGQPDWPELHRKLAQLSLRSNGATGWPTVQSEPCCYAIPRSVKRGWRWVPPQAALG